MKEYEKYFVINEFDEGWGMDGITSEDQLYEYCIEALFLPEDKIEELNMINAQLEITLANIEYDDIDEDWYVNLVKTSVDAMR